MREVTTGLRFPEGPVVMADGSVIVVEIEAGRITRVGADGAKADGSEIREVAGPVDAPNGIGLSPAGDRVYVAETYTAAIWAWNVSAPGEIEPVEGIIPNGGTPLGRLAGFVGIDSLAVDAEG